MPNYETTLWWSDEDALWVAEVPELPGCMAHGVSQEEALSNARSAIELWLNVARRAGDPIPEPKRRRVANA